MCMWSGIWYETIAMYTLLYVLTHTVHYFIDDSTDAQGSWLDTIGHDMFFIKLE